MSVLRETFFLNRSNVIRFVLSEGTKLFKDAYPTVVPSRWVFTINSTEPLVIDSDDVPIAFDWDQTTSTLEIHGGTLVVEAMNYTSATLVVYAPEWQEGVVWFNPTCTSDKVFIRVCNQS